MNRPQQQQQESKFDEAARNLATHASSNLQLGEEDPLMLLPREKRRALTLKEAVRADPDLGPLSDFMYAQFAIVSLVDEIPLDKVVQQIQRFQGFKDEYGIEDTYEHAETVVARMILDVTPGTHLAFGRCSGDRGSYWHAVDITNFDSLGILGNPYKTASWMANEFYIKHACFPDFEAIRHGVVALTECKNYDWKDPTMFNLKAFRKFNTEFVPTYPMYVRVGNHYNTGAIINFVVSACKRLLPPHMVESFQTCEVPGGGTLSELFLTPDLETASRKLLKEVNKALQRRYENEAAFSLGEESPASAD